MRSMLIGLVIGFPVALATGDRDGSIVLSVIFWWAVFGVAARLLLGAVAGTRK
jgi:hypothetical protein